MTVSLAPPSPSMPGKVGQTPAQAGLPREMPGKRFPAPRSRFGDSGVPSWGRVASWTKVPGETESAVTSVPRGRTTEVSQDSATSCPSAWDARGSRLCCHWVVVLQKEPNQSPAGLAPCFRGCNKRSLLPTALILCTFLHSHQIPWVFHRVREEAPAPLLLYKAAVSTTTLRRWGKRGRHGTGPSCAVGLEAPRRAPAPRDGFVWPQLPGELRLPKQTASPNPTQQQQQRRFN